MELESWEDSDVEYQYRSSTPIFTSDDEQYPPALLSGKSRALVPAARPPVLAPRLVLTSSFGQRKQRRFENDLLMVGGGSSALWGMPREFGRAGMNPTMASLCAQLENLGFEGGAFEPYELSDSVFAQMAKQDKVLSEAFFEGEADPILNSRPSRLVLSDAPSKGNKTRSARTKTRGGSVKKSSVAAYARVDKKARKHLSRALDFTRGLEEVLLRKGTFIDCGQVRRVKDSSSQETVTVSLESPFLRMLAHGVAQFYSIPSRTVKDERGRSQVRFTLRGDPEERLLFGELSVYLEHLTD
jgi:hypothetical protein